MTEKEKVFQEVLKLDEMISDSVKQEDVISIMNSNTLLKVAPNSSDYIVGEEKFKEPFYLQMTDYDLMESVSMGLSLHEMEKLIRFLQEKVSYIKENRKTEE